MRVRFNWTSFNGTPLQTTLQPQGFLSIPALLSHGEAVVPCKRPYNHKDLYLADEGSDAPKPSVERGEFLLRV
jgi:hypothetical protein